MKKETSKLIKKHTKNNQKALKYANNKERNFTCLGILFIMIISFLWGGFLSWLIFK